MKKYYLFVFALSLLLVGSGCGVGSFSGCDVETNHNSCLEDGVDTALVGSWTLVSQETVTGQGTLLNPFSGRTTVFGDDGLYSEDYNSEGTDDVIVSGIISHCDVTNILSGSWKAYSEVDLDVLDDDSGYSDVSAAERYFLMIGPDGGSPRVVCGTSGEALSSNAASIPLGVGPVSGDPPLVTYEYSFNDSLDELVIVQNNDVTGVSLRSTFRR